MTQHIAHTGSAFLDGDAQRLGLNYKLRKILTAKSTLAVLLASPLLILIAGLILYPFCYAIYLAMQNKSETAFVGFKNFEFLFKRDTFWMVAQQSTVFALSAVFFKALIGFILAHVINVLPDKKQRLWRGLVLVPWVMPPALSTLAWWWLFDPSYSAINWLLTMVAGVSIPWLSDPFWARFSVILVNVWYGSPFFLIMYLAGLKSVPQDLYEAASIDGATAIQKMMYVTIPMMRNIIAITVLFSTIVTFANFDIVRVLTNGGPRNMTDLFGTWSFKLGIGSGDIPLAAAVSLFIFPMLAILAIFILRNVSKRTTRNMTDQVLQHATPAIKSTSMRRSRRWALIFAYIALAIFVVFFLFPPYYMIITSFKTDAEISSLKGIPWIINESPTLHHYKNLFTNTLFPTFFWNTIQVTVVSVIVSMLISIIAAYSLARMRFFGSTVLATGVFLTYLVPDTLLFIPLFKVVGGLGLLDSKWALALVFPTLAVPFCTWIMMGYFASIPKELDEAALIDGAGHMQMLIRIFIPVALPGIIAATIFAFTVSWAGFLYPAAFIFKNEEMTLTVGTVTTLIRGDVFHWGGLMAGALIAAAPPVLIYAFLMDYYISGLTAGATKG